MVVDRGDPCKGIYCLSATKALLLRNGKNAVQTLVKLRFSNGIYQSRRVMRHIKGILHCISLLKTSPWLIRIKIFYKFSVGTLRMHELILRVENLPPAI